MNDIQFFEYRLRGRPALWFVVPPEGATHTSDIPWNEFYPPDGEVAEAFQAAIYAMRVWVQEGGSLDSLPDGWAFLHSVDGWFLPRAGEASH